MEPGVSPDAAYGLRQVSGEQAGAEWSPGVSPNAAYLLPDWQQLRALPGAPPPPQSLATFGMLAGSTIAAATFYLTGSNYELTFAVAIVPPALALAWMVHNFRDEVFGPVHGESECG